MRYICHGSASELLVAQPKAAAADGGATGQTQAQDEERRIGRGESWGDVIVLPLRNARGRAWALKQPGTTAHGDCEGRRRGWACKPLEGPCHEVPCQHRTRSYWPGACSTGSSTLSVPAAGCTGNVRWGTPLAARCTGGGAGCSLWAREEASAGRLCAHTGNSRPANDAPAAAAPPNTPERELAPPGGPKPSAPPRPQPPAASPSAAAVSTEPLGLLPSVPALAIGDVFLACNTVAGFEHADDWDLGLSGEATAASAPRGEPPPARAPHARYHAPRPPPPPLELGSELLLRMSAPVGGQRLVFVSKEGAELARRALLLSRYDEIVEARRASGEPTTSAARDTAAAAATPPPPPSDSNAPSSSHPLQALLQLPHRLHSAVSMGAAAFLSGFGDGLGEKREAKDGTVGVFGAGFPERHSTAAGLSEHMIDALAAAGRGVGSLLDPRYRGGGAGGGAGGADAVDVPSGPAPRLPAPPKTWAMQLPEQLAAGRTAAGAGDAGGEGAGGSARQEGSAAVRALLSDESDESFLAELRRLEEERVIHDAEALLRARDKPLGGGSGSTGGGGFLPPFSFSSYVARLPLEAALKALLGTPQTAPAAATPTSVGLAVDSAGSAPALRAAQTLAQPAEGRAVVHEASADESDAGGGGAPAYGLDSATARAAAGSAAALKPAVATAAAAAAAASASELPPHAPVRRRFVLVPDAADEQAVEGSREVDRLVAEASAEAAAEAAEAEQATGADEEDSDGNGGGGGTRDGKAGTGMAQGAAFGLGPRPRVALNVYDSDSRHWVLDVVEQLESDATAEEDAGGAAAAASTPSSPSSPSSQPPAQVQARQARQARQQVQAQGAHAAAERLIAGASRGPTEDLGGLVHLPPAAAASSNTVGPADSDHDAYDGSGTYGGGTDGGGGRGGGRTPVFLLPGVTLSVRAADGTLLRLRPAFLSLQQLAGAASLVRDVAVAGWRRQRAAARWKLVSALDVLAVHGAGFPIMRLPQQPPPPAGGAAGGGGSNGGGGDEDSDEGIPEAKDLLREMGVGNRRPAPPPPTTGGPTPSGPLVVLSTMAVGVLSLGAWCLAAGADTWDAIYSRTPWGRDEVGVPEHINVRPTYLEDHLQLLAEANAPAVAAAAARASAAATHRPAEKRNRRRAAASRQAPAEPQPQAPGPQDPQAQLGEQQQQQQQQRQQQQQGHEPIPVGCQERTSPPAGAAAPQEHSKPTAGAAAETGASSPDGTSPALNAHSASTADGAATASHQKAAERAAAGRPRSAPSKKQQHGAARQRAGAAGRESWGGLELQSETLAGLSVLLQFSWAVVTAAQDQVDRLARGEISADGRGLVDGAAGSGGGGATDGLLRLAAGRGGSGLTLTASEDGELGMIARLDIRPMPTAALAGKPTAIGTAGQHAAGGANAASGASSTAARDADAGAPVDTPGIVGSGPHASDASVSGAAAAAPVGAGEEAVAAAEGAPKGLSVRDLGSTGRSGRRFELMQSASKLASQVSRPHKFEVGLHLNLRKLMGDLPEDAPDVLLPLQQPAGPMPVHSPPPASGANPAPAAPASAPDAGGTSSQQEPMASTSGADGTSGPAPGAATSRRGGGGGAAAAAAQVAPEAYGLILVGDLGLDPDAYDDGARRPPSFGFADLAGFLDPGALPPMHPMEAAVRARGDEHPGSGGIDSEEENWPEGGQAWGGGGLKRGAGGRPGGWATGPGRGVWGRWDR